MIINNNYYEDKDELFCGIISSDKFLLALLLLYVAVEKFNNIIQ